MGAIDIIRGSYAVYGTRGLSAKSRLPSTSIRPQSLTLTSYAAGGLEDETYRLLTSVSGANVITAVFSAVNAFGQAQAVLTRVVPTTGAQSIGQLPADLIMTLDVVLPVRDQASLDGLAKQVSDPASPSYRHYLTAPEFTARFGPSQSDYDALVQFLRTKGFTVVGGTRDSMDVAINGPVSAVESAFNVRMLTYRHPTESRTYYAPDREPTVNLPF